MTLSEAAILGLARRPQAQGLPFCYVRPGVLASCFVGAAYEGLTGETETTAMHVYAVVRAAFPIAGRPVVCPMVGCGDTGPLLSACAHLNDTHEFSREAIAAWVQEQEAA